jgi:rSAM/selenodomain-associated transferase 1
MTSLLGMFAKHWTPGRVKTRLAAAIGERQAAEVHRLFVQTLQNRFGGEADLRILAFDPPHGAADFRHAAGRAWELLPQGGGDLGERMAGFFAAGLVRAEQVVLIGSDSPDLPASYVAEAFEALTTHDVVLGPAADGGYYLVGAAGQVPPIFADIAWSTADVWSQTVQRLEQAHCRWHELPQWYDVDTADDLIRLRLCLRQNRGTDAWLTNLADQLLALLANPLP